jgi:DNA-binding transcriptional ArsR family regulator/uncharacterized protein YndB with AHSA1/START domain
MISAVAAPGPAEPDLWRALASPWRRQLLDLLRDGPRTTGDLAAAVDGLSRFAVMQHLGVLTEAGLVIPERRGRDRFNYLNPVPLREWYARWAPPRADTGAAGLLTLKRAAEQEAAEQKEDAMAEPDAPPQAGETFRTVRLAFELRIQAPAGRVFEVMTQRSHEWFPPSFGGGRTHRVVLEPRVGGQHYEDWGDGRGHLYGQVTAWDPPAGWATRGRLMPGTVLDTEYELEADGGGTVVRVTKVAAGPISAQDAAGIATYGDLRGYAPAIEKLAAG